LRKSGTALWYHGDFDWPGMAIASRVIGELGARAWLLSASDYEQAIVGGKTRPLDGTPVETPWSPELSQV
jgi:hypothetical protein